MKKLVKPNKKQLINSLVALAAAIGLLINTMGMAIDELKKSDIAQVFITTGEEITKDHYCQAEIVVMDQEGKVTIHDDSAKIKIRGNSTAVLLKKPFNIKFSKKESMLGMAEGKKWCLLAIPIKRY